MGHSIGDGIVVAALAAAFIAYWYFEHKAKVRRLEIIHQERLSAMDKGVPLPELPIDPPVSGSTANPHAVLIHAVVWLAFSIGGMIVLFYLLSPQMHRFWIAPLPLTFLGIGLMLYYVLTRDRAR
jgi:hypothetical protein